MNTPHDPTPLDILKQTVLRIDGLISNVQDMLGQHRVDDLEAPSIEIEQEILDSARMELWNGLATVVPGLAWDPQLQIPSASESARDEIRTYSDGTPVYIVIDLSPGRSADYYPRLDGDIGEFVRLIRDDEIARSIAEPRDERGRQ